MPAAAEIDDAKLKEIFFSNPLYTKWTGEEESIASAIANLRRASKSFDHYCPDCKKETVWRLIPTEDAKRTHELSQAVSRGNSLNKREISRWISDGNFELTILCERYKHHHIKVSFSVRSFTSDSLRKWELVKYGQYPSLVDLNSGNKQFDGVISATARTDYRRAMELTAYGFAIGAFVHYRRVLEMLIEQAKTEAIQDDAGFDVSGFEGLQTIQQRVKALGDRIPQFVAERPEMYRILSEGVHAWTEDKCGKVLPLMKLAIDTVLEQELERKMKATRKREIELQLQQLDAQNNAPSPVVSKQK